MLNRAWSAISLPWSQVSERRSWPGSVVMASLRASATASAPCPPGSATSMTNRLARSTRVAMVRLAGAEHDVALPVAGHSPVGGLGGPPGEFHHAPGLAPAVHHPP